MIYLLTHWFNIGSAFSAKAYATASSKNTSKDIFKQSLNVKIERPVVSAITQKKLANSSVSAREKAEDAIVRLRNSQDREIGRIVQKDAESVTATYECLIQY